MERLRHIINQTVKEERWKPIKLSRNDPSLSHLFSADDLLLFVKATHCQMETIMNCHNTFCLASGQKINLHKSSIVISIGMDEDVARQIF